MSGFERLMQARRHQKLPLPPRARGWVLVALPVFVLATAAHWAARAEPIAIEASGVPLDREHGSLRKVGRLTYLGGLRLTSADARFGGWSGLAFDDEGRLLSVSDHGFILRARLESAPDGRPVALTDAEIAPLRREDGQPLEDKRLADAEAIEWLGNDTVLVSFERYHRLDRYDLSRGLEFALPTPAPTPATLEGAPENGGLEAVTPLGPERFLLITEDFAVDEGVVQGWLMEGRKAYGLSYVTKHLFKPTDLARLPDGELLLLERRYTPIAGPGARLVRIAAKDVVPGARLEGEELARLVEPLTVDNMEGLAVGPGENGRPRLYLISDDNYNRLLQATLLLVFELELPR